MAKLPFKIRILEYAYEQDKPFTAKDVLRDLRSEYGGEGQFNLKRVQDYLQSFLGVKFFKEEKIEYDNNGELIVTCSITDYGKSRIKYIPGHSDVISKNISANQ